MAIKWESIKTFEDIKYERGIGSAEGIAKITINRPEVRNAFSPQTVFEIKESLKNAEIFSDQSDNVLNAPYFLPYMSGERTPHNDPHVRGSFHYLKTTNDKASLQYSFLEGVSFGILDGVKSIETVNNNFTQILMVGGGSRSSFWINLLAYIINNKL